MQTELTSWKEIADYLGVTVRTAQMWEQQRGLPVHRLPGPRGRVSAVVQELEQWKQGPDRPDKNEAPAANPSTPPDRTERTALRRPVALLLVLVFIVLLVALRAAQSRFNGTAARIPAGWQVVNNTLIVADAKGNEIWRRTFP